MSVQKEATIFRDVHDQDHPYVQVARAMMCDTSISPKAKGILVYILGQRSDFNIFHSHLCRALAIGKDYLNSAIEELINAGYCQRARQKLKGQYQPYTYRISEYPKFKEKITERKNRSGKTAAEKPPVTTMHSLTENALEETTTTEQEEVVVVPFSKKSKGNAKLSDVEQALYDEGLDAASINTISKLNPTIEAVRNAIELSRSATYQSLGAWLHQCIKHKWGPSKSKSKASQTEDAKAKQDEMIEARRQKAIKLLKKYPESFEIQENAIMIQDKKGRNFLGFASEEIEAFFEYLIKSKGEK